MARLTPPKPHNTTAEQTLLDCPVCLTPIKAEISVEATFGEATYHGPQDVTLPVETKLLAFNVLHSCEGPPSDDPAPVGGDRA
jgi:hypothetical protein